MTVTMEYVDTRFAQFVSKYESVLKHLNYAEAEIGRLTENLAQRLKARDFKLYGTKPIQFLHSGKRVTRFLIKSAVEYSPAQRAKRDALRAQYHAKIAEERRRNPTACFFSFEAAYADKLKVNLRTVRDFFRL